MTPNICHRQRESQISPHGNPESEWPQPALGPANRIAAVDDLLDEGSDTLVHHVIAAFSHCIQVRILGVAQDAEDFFLWQQIGVIYRQHQ